jgi:protein-tyrosine phosphatase
VEHSVTGILLVCTGNVCRSPAAERLLAHSLAHERDLQISSAGTRALVDQPMDAEMAELVRARGARPEGFRARLLSAGLLRRADLVLVMAREHRSAVVALEPTAVRRTFLLLEIADVAERIADAGWPSGLGGAGARLAALPTLAPPYRADVRLREADFDVPDPYRRTRREYAEAMSRVTGAVHSLAVSVGAQAGSKPVGDPIG